MSDLKPNQSISNLFVEQPFRYPSYIHAFGTTLLIMGFFSPVINFDAGISFFFTFSVTDLKDSFDKSLPYDLLLISLLLSVVTTIIYLVPSFNEYRSFGMWSSITVVILNGLALWEINQLRSVLDDVLNSYYGADLFSFEFGIGFAFLVLSTLLHALATGMDYKYKIDVQKRIEKLNLIRLKRDQERIR